MTATRTRSRTPKETNRPVSRKFILNRLSGNFTLIANFPMATDLLAKLDEFNDLDESEKELIEAVRTANGETGYTCPIVTETGDIVSRFAGTVLVQMGEESAKALADLLDDFDTLETHVYALREKLHYYLNPCPPAGDTADTEAAPSYHRANGDGTK